MFVCFACLLSPLSSCFPLRAPFTGPFQGSFYGAPFRAPFRGSFYGAPCNVTVPRVTLIFILNGFLITSQDDGLSTLDSFQANSSDCIDYSQ